jgi:hypothetical protein
VLSELVLALPAVVVVGVLPGWFWARVLLASTDLYERIAYSVALSTALVPAVALLPMRLLGTGVTLAVAVGAPLVVFFLGLGVYLRYGPAKGPEGPLAAPARVLGTPALVLVGAALALGLGVMIGVVPGVPIEPLVTVRIVPGPRDMLAIALLVFFAGIVHLIESYRQPAPHADLQEHPLRTRRLPTFLARLLLPAVLVLALVRGYSGPILHDWPFIRGVDHYSHAVMAELMMTKGEIEPYLIYPPGFHTMSALICRLSGLEPLELFPVVAPLLLLLPALGLYALAGRVWGWEYGVGAAFLSVMLGGTYYYYNDAMYPNLVTSQFLMVVVVAALVELYGRGTGGGVVRAGVLLAVLGSSIVLYHQVASLYLVMVLGVVGISIVPYLLVRDWKRGVGLVSSLGLMSLLSLVYAWDTYDLPQAVGGLLGESAKSDTGAAVIMAIGTQAPYPLFFLTGNMLSQPVAWLGLLGVLLVVVELLLRRGMGTPQRLTYLTLLLWAVLIFLGSRLWLTGFPQRFGRDLGIPLAVFAAFALVGILRSLPLSSRQVAAVFVASLTVVLSASLVGLRAVESLDIASGPSVQLTITPQISAAGEWLREHNSGGNIMVSPHNNQVPSRMMLAMGGYSALQSFETVQIENPRDLPPTGQKPPRDVLWVMNHPEGERTQRLLREHEVSYIVLYKQMPDRATVDYWKGFEDRPDLYRRVFENEDVLIVTRRSQRTEG